MLHLVLVHSESDEVYRKRPSLGVRVSHFRRHGKTDCNSKLSRTMSELGSSEGVHALARNHSLLAHLRTCFRMLRMCMQSDLSADIPPALRAFAALLVSILNERGT